MSEVYSQRGMSMRHSILRGGYMSYIRAEEVLPKELIEAIQQYISGENIYIPCVEKKDWGSQTETKKYYKDRNKEICDKSRQGVSTIILAEEYFLSEKSIRRIIRSEREAG